MSAILRAWDIVSSFCQIHVIDATGAHIVTRGWANGYSNYSRKTKLNRVVAGTSGPGLIPRRFHRRQFLFGGAGVDLGAGDEHH
jgi:hypothetical protein